MACHVCLLVSASTQRFGASMYSRLASGSYLGPTAMMGEGMTRKSLSMSGQMAFMYCFLIRVSLSWRGYEGLHARHSTTEQGPLACGSHTRIATSEDGRQWSGPFHLMSMFSASGATQLRWVGLAGQLLSSCSRLRYRVYAVSAPR